jgi:acetamidase/formamidase
VADHSVAASPETVHWGYFDASLPPILTVEPGDTVTLSTVSGSPEMMPASGFHVPPALRAIHAAMRPKQPGHICTGPVAIRGARAGQTLEVRIKAIDLHYDWGFTYSAPQKGALPDDFESMHLMHVALDPDRRIGRLPWGQTLDLKPFFGVMAVAPPASWGALSTLPPRRNGGNLDNKELVAGTTLYLPIHVDGALFSVGDGHGLQGDGEVCVTAIETGLVGHLRTAPAGRHGSHLAHGRDANPSDDDGLRPEPRRLRDDRPAQHARPRERPNRPHPPGGLRPCSLVADLRITQVVNGNKGVHVMIEKQHLHRVEGR